MQTLLRTMGVSSKEYYVTHAVVYFLILTVNSLLLYAPVCIIIRVRECAEQGDVYEKAPRRKLTRFHLVLCLKQKSTKKN